MNPQNHHKLPFSRKNWKLFFVGLAVTLLGYVLLSIPPATGILSLTIAPLLLLVGYIVLIPLSILLKDSDSSATPPCRS